MTKRSQTLFLSSVGGGPIARLVSRSNRTAWCLVSGMSAESWQRRMASGGLARSVARLQSAALFPAVAFLRACEPSVKTVVPTTNPFYLPFLMLLGRPIHGAKVVPLIYDLYPDAAEAANLGEARGLFSRIATLMNRQTFERSDAIVFIGREMARHAHARYGQPRREAVIETGADRTEHERAEARRSETRREFLDWCGDDTLVTYSGNLGLMHDWRTLAGGLERYLGAAGDDGDIKVIVVAFGPGAEELRAHLGERFSGRIRFMRPLDDLAWADLLARSDISMVSLSAAARYASIPSKVFSAMAAGNALLVVAPKGSDLANLVESAGSGELVAPGDEEGFDLALRRMSKAKHRKKLRDAGLKAIEETYDLGVLTEQWAKVLKEIDVEGDQPHDSIKRALDLLISATCLVVSFPLLLGIAAAIRSTMGAPVLFRQARPGKDGVPFRLLKFRTMREPDLGEEQLATDSARLTRLGSLLRSTSLDELPTLLNVLKGEMSIVGPRPLLMQYLDRYTPRQARRHGVKPGVTGWAQIHGRNALDWESKLEHDVWYVENRGLFLDLMILGRTFWKVVARDGISAEGFATMPEFLGTDG